MKYLFLAVCLCSFRVLAQPLSITEQQKIERSLDFAGQNRIELQKVLDHYASSTKDSLKLRSGRFLIANMIGHFSYNGYQKSGVDSIVRYLSAAKEKVGNDDWRPGTFLKLDELWSHAMDQAQAQHSGPEYLFDNHVITADLLIENIDDAFKAWAMPWSRHLSFADFCAYVLPYRFYDEPLGSWRKQYMARFAWLPKAMGNSTDPVLACKLINEYLQQAFPFNRALARYIPALGPDRLLEAGPGKCLDQAGLANFAMRAMGIPVRLELVRQWANRSLGHKFSSVLAADGNFVAFMGGESAPYQTNLPYVAAKIYSVNYAIQNEYLLEGQIKSDNIIPGWDAFLQDNTRSFIPVKNLQLSLPPGTAQPGERVYLCVFDNRQWVPVCSSLTKDAKSVGFKDMGLGAVYLPMLDRGQLIPAGVPFILKQDGTTSSIMPQIDAKETLLLSRKYPLSQQKEDWLWLMLGGKFEGANQPDFTDSKVLYTVKSPFYMMLNRRFFPKNTYRYVRYCFPKDAYGSLAEICFYGDTMFSNPLQGMPIRSQKVSEADLQTAFNGSIGDFIHTHTASEYNGQWIGLDLGLPTTIAGVGISPRNDENGIDKQMSYELYYWNDQWVSLGAGTVISGERTDLKFENVPKRALLWLRNHSAGNEERIFLYNDGKQQWW